MNLQRMTPTQQGVLAVAVIGGAYLLLRKEDRVLVEPQQEQTLSNTALSGIARRIYAAFWQDGWGTEDEVGMATALLECGNDKDVWKVAQYYPSEAPYYFSNDYDLFQAFNVGLDNDERQALNEELSSKGITIHF